MKSDSCGNHCANDAKIGGGDRENEAECGCTPCGQPKACLGDEENAMTDALESTETASDRVPYPESISKDSEGDGVVKNDSRVDGREAPSKAGFWWVEYETGFVLVDGPIDDFYFYHFGDECPFEGDDLENEEGFVAWREEALPLNKMSTEKLIKELKLRGVVQGELVDTFNLLAEIDERININLNNNVADLIDLKNFILAKKG